MNSLIKAEIKNQAYEELDGFNLVLDAVLIGDVTIYRIDKEVNNVVYESETVWFTELDEAFKSFHRRMESN